MKRIFLILVFVGVAACCGALLFVKRLPGASSHPPLSAGWVPADALVYAQLWDVTGSLERFRASDLAALMEKPGMQQFVGRTLKRPMVRSILEWARQLEALRIREAFIVSTAMGPGIPRFLAGFASDAPREEVDRLLARAEATVAGRFPTGRASVTELDGVKVRTFHADNWMLASCTHRDHYLVASDLELMRAALGRIGRRPRQGCLALARPFREAIEQLPQQRESLVFADVARLKAALPEIGTGAMLSSSERNDLERATVFAASTSIENGRLRDVLFLGSDSRPASGQRLTLDSLKVTSADTRLYAALMLAPRAADPALPDEAVEAGNPPGAWLAAMRQHGIGPNEFSEAFGDEAALGVDWSGRGLPQGYLVLRVRDARGVRRVVEALPKAMPGTTVVSHGEDGLRATFVRMRPGGLPFPVEPVLLTDARHAVLAFHEKTAATVLGRGHGGEPTLKVVDRFQQVRRVNEAAEMFVFVDTGELLALTVDTIRGMGVFMQGFLRPLEEWVDLQSLPPGESLSAGIGPSSISVTPRPSGTLVESEGSVTCTQMAGAVAVGGLIVSLPQAWELLKP